MSNTREKKGRPDYLLLYFGKNPKDVLNTEFVYRGDKQLPAEVFDKGFKAKGSGKAKGTDAEIFSHINPVGLASDPNSPYISTSKSKQVAETFPKRSMQTYVYKINHQRNGIDVSKHIIRFGKEHKLQPEDVQFLLSEREVSVPHTIKPGQIEGAWSVETIIDMEALTNPNVKANKVLSKNYAEFLKNPHYSNTWAAFLLNTAKNVGYGLAIVGTGIEGVCLIDTYKESISWGDPTIFHQELARTTGSWATAFTVGWAGAQTGGLIGSTFGPVGTAVGALVGGFTCSIYGYYIGGELGEAAFKFSFDRLGVQSYPLDFIARQRSMRDMRKFTSKEVTARRQLTDLRYDENPVTRKSLMAKEHKESESNSKNIIETRVDETYPELPAFNIKSRLIRKALFSEQNSNKKMIHQVTQSEFETSLSELVKEAENILRDVRKYNISESVLNKIKLELNGHFSKKLDELSSFRNELLKKDEASEKKKWKMAEDMASIIFDGIHVVNNVEDEHRELYNEKKQLRKTIQHTLHEIGYKSDLECYSEASFNFDANRQNILNACFNRLTMDFTRLVERNERSSETIKSMMNLLSLNQIASEGNSTVIDFSEENLKALNRRIKQLKINTDGLSYTIGASQFSFGIASVLTEFAGMSIPILGAFKILSLTVGFISSIIKRNKEKRLQDELNHLTNSINSNTQTINTLTDTNRALDQSNAYNKSVLSAKIFEICNSPAADAATQMDKLTVLKDVQINEQGTIKGHLTKDRKKLTAAEGDRDKAITAYDKEVERVKKHVKHTKYDGEHCVGCSDCQSGLEEKKQELDIAQSKVDNLKAVIAQYELRLSDSEDDVITIDQLHTDIANNKSSFDRIYHFNRNREDKLIEQNITSDVKTRHQITSEVNQAIYNTIVSDVHYIQMGIASLDEIGRGLQQAFGSTGVSKAASAGYLMLNLYVNYTILGDNFKDLLKKIEEAKIAKLVGIPIEVTNPEYRSKTNGFVLETIRQAFMPKPVKLTAPSSLDKKPTLKNPIVDPSAGTEATAAILELPELSASEIFNIVYGADNFMTSIINPGATILGNLLSLAGIVRSFISPIEEPIITAIFELNRNMTKMIAQAVKLLSTQQADLSKDIELLIVKCKNEITSLVSDYGDSLKSTLLDLKQAVAQSNVRLNTEKNELKAIETEFDGLSNLQMNDLQRAKLHSIQFMPMILQQHHSTFDLLRLRQYLMILKVYLTDAVKPANNGIDKIRKSDLLSTNIKERDILAGVKGSLSQRVQIDVTKPKQDNTSEHENKSEHKDTIEPSKNTINRGDLCNVDLFNFVATEWMSIVEFIDNKKTEISNANEALSLLFNDSLYVDIKNMASSLNYFLSSLVTSHLISGGLIEPKKETENLIDKIKNTSLLYTAFSHYVTETQQLVALIQSLYDNDIDKLNVENAFNYSKYIKQFEDNFINNKYLSRGLGQRRNLLTNILMEHRDYIVDVEYPGVMVLRNFDQLWFYRNLQEALPNLKTGTYYASQYFALQYIDESKKIVEIPYSETIEKNIQSESVLQIFVTNNMIECYSYGKQFSAKNVNSIPALQDYGVVSFGSKHPRLVPPSHLRHKPKTEAPQVWCPVRRENKNASPEMIEDSTAIFTEGFTKWANEYLKLLVSANNSSSRILEKVEFASNKLGDCYVVYPHSSMRERIPLLISKEYIDAIFSMRLHADKQSEKTGLGKIIYEYSLQKTDLNYRVIIHAKFLYLTEILIDTHLKTKDPEKVAAVIAQIDHLTVESYMQESYHYLDELMLFLMYGTPNKDLRKAYRFGLPGDKSFRMGKEFVIYTDNVPFAGLHALANNKPLMMIYDCKAIDMNTTAKMTEVIVISNIKSLIPCQDLYDQHLTRIWNIQVCEEARNSKVVRAKINSLQKKYVMMIAAIKLISSSNVNDAKKILDDMGLTAWNPCFSAESLKMGAPEMTDLYAIYDDFSRFYNDNVNFIRSYSDSKVLSSIMQLAKSRSSLWNEVLDIYEKLDGIDFKLKPHVNKITTMDSGDSIAKVLLNETHSQNRNALFNLAGRSTKSNQNEAGTGLATAKTDHLLPVSNTDKLTW